MKLTNLKSKFLPFFLGLAACATSSTASKSLSIEELGRITYGKTQSSALVERFGQPSRVISLKDKVVQNLRSYDVWSYQVSTPSGMKDRVNFMVSSNTGIVETASWQPLEGESLSREKNALTAFNMEKIQPIERGWVAGHYFSRDATYSDEQQGISIAVSEGSRSVSAIGFRARGSKSDIQAQNR